MEQEFRIILRLRANTPDGKTVTEARIRRILQNYLHPKCMGEEVVSVRVTDVFDDTRKEKR